LTVSHPETDNPGKGNCQRERAKLSTGVDPNRNNRSEQRGAPSAPAAKQPPPDARIKAFIDWFSQTYKAALRRPYVLSGGKDGATVKRLLHALDGNGDALAELQQAARNMLADPWGKDRADVGLLGSKINSWLGKATHGPAARGSTFTPAPAGTDYDSLAQHF
jgi:hypothetical protein